MIKLLMLTLSLMTNLYQKNFVKIEEDTNTIAESYEKQGYVLKTTEDDQVLSINDYEIMHFPKHVIVKWSYDHYKLKVVTCDKGVLQLYEMDKYGQVLQSKTYLSTFTTIDLISFKDHLYLIGGVTSFHDGDITNNSYHQKEDAIIIMLDSKYNIQKAVCYGGILNDRFIEAKCDDKYLYVRGKKETLSGGDFGNGGGEEYGDFICTLDENLQLINYGIFKEEILTYTINNDWLYIVTKKQVYKLDHDFNYQNGLKFASDCVFSMFTVNDTLLTFTATELNIYDLPTFENLYHEEFEVLDKVYLGPDCFYLLVNDRCKKVKLYDVRDFHGESGHVYNCFREVTLVQKTITPTYNPLVYGTYTVHCDYGDLSLDEEMTVPLECNVCEGVIYPVGYRLKFTGVAYLNGEMVNNNHALNQIGKQELTLYSCQGDSVTYHFSVASDQINFLEESIKDYQLEVYPHEEFTITMKLTSLDGINIKEVIINEERTNFIIDGNNLIIKLKAEDSGLSHYQLQRIIYENNNETFVKEINQTIDVKVLNLPLSINTTMTNDKDYVIYNSHVEDINQEMRGFKLYLYRHGEEITYSYAVKDTDIVLRGLNPDEIYEGCLMVQYAYNNKDVKEIPLARFNLTGISEARIGYLDIIQSGESLEQFQIGIKQKYLNTVYYLNQPLELHTNEGLFVPIFCGALIGTVLGLSFLYFRLHKKRKPLS